MDFPAASPASVRESAASSLGCRLSIMTNRLVTIGISHFCEKARCALQRAGVPFQEERNSPHDVSRDLRKHRRSTSGSPTRGELLERKRDHAS
jgi:hypothetical protein